MELFWNIKLKTGQLRMHYFKPEHEMSLDLKDNDIFVCTNITVEDAKAIRARLSEFIRAAK